MRFPNSNQLHLPCTLEEIVPGALHSDGRRYLPLMLLRPLHQSEGILGVVDRHHVVASSHVGQTGIARLVFLLSHIRIQEPPFHQGLDLENRAGRPSTMPSAYGQIQSVPTWEARRGNLPFESLYAELLLDAGIGIVGVRTSTTAENIETAIGKPQIVPGDWISVTRSRIDILEFSPLNND